MFSKARKLIALKDYVKYSSFDEEKNSRTPSRPYLPQYIGILKAGNV